MNQTVL